MAETKWRVIAGHVRRRVLEWKCETSALETLKWCRPFQNSTSRLRPCLSPTAHNYCRQPSKSGGAWEHYSWAKQLQPVNGIQVVMFTYIQALHKVFPSSHPPSMPMLKAVIYRHQIFLMLYWVRHVGLPHLNSTSGPLPRGADESLALHVLMVIYRKSHIHPGETTVPLTSPTASVPVIELLSFSTHAHRCRQRPSMSGCIDFDIFGRLDSRKGKTCSVDSSHDPFQSVRLREPGSASA